MNVDVYREVRPEHADEVLRDGLQCRDSGEKSDRASERADAFLDERVPAELAAKGVGRQRVVYGYLAADGMLVEIRSGDPSTSRILRTNATSR